MRETPFEVKGPILGPNSIFMVLIEKNGPRLCHMGIDPFVAHVLAFLSGDQEKPARPLTHQLILNTLERVGFNLEKIVVSELIDDVYRAILYLKNDKNITLEIDARPSDAICLALIKKCPMLVKDEFLQINDQVTQILNQVYRTVTKEVLPIDKNSLTDQQALDILRNFNPDKSPKH